jgi:fatty-acyl-CoA synthase
VPQRLIDAFADRGVPVLNLYGSTETCPIAIYPRLSGNWRKAGSIGLPGLLCDARIIDDDGRELPAGTPGEVAVRGPNVFCEYWGNPEATRDALRDGWYRSGDIGVRDADGYFHIHERKKNMIISGGENIYPAEVERVLLEHPAVAEAAVVGSPDPKWQEVPVGCVVRRAGMAATAAELEAHCLAQLARFKAPRRFVFLDALPRNALGKVQHFLLKQQIESAG